MNASNELSRLRVPFTDLIDLAVSTVGGKVLFATDEFFAPKENLLNPWQPVFLPDKYVDTGKWMDGWESRRKRNLRPGDDHDWCILQLGLPGVIRGVNIDTSFFTGNYPEYASLEACTLSSNTASLDELHSQTWREILPKSKLQGGMGNLFSVSSIERWTHLRLRIFPDGGVARLRVYGEVQPDWNRVQRSDDLFDFAAAANGGSVIVCSDMYFGKKDNLILPGRAENMSSGWETKRRRGPGYDWTIIRLARSSKIRKIEVDTNHFKGNFPESCSIEACSHSNRDLSEVDFRDRNDLVWKEVLPRTKLKAHTQQYFQEELSRTIHDQKVDYVRLNIFPDGGISRFRVYGVLE